MNLSLKNKRLEVEVTQLEIARQSYITDRQYRRIEAGEQEPGVYTAQRIVKILGSTVEDLFPLPERQFRETEKHPDSNQVNQQLNHSIKRYDM